MERNLEQSPYEEILFKANPITLPFDVLRFDSLGEKSHELLNEMILPNKMIILDTPNMP